jgi:hypothetical protein
MALETVGYVNLARRCYDHQSGVELPSMLFDAHNGCSEFADAAWWASIHDLGVR